MLVVIRGDCNSKWEEACGYENDVVIYTMSYPSYEAELTKGNVLPYDDLDAQLAERDIARLDGKEVRKAETYRQPDAVAVGALTASISTLAIINLVKPE